MVGSACFEILNDNGFTNIITRGMLDLSSSEVNAYLKKEKPEVVIDAARVRVYGLIMSFLRFLMENLLIQNNLIKASVKIKSKSLFFGKFVYLSEILSSTYQKNIYFQPPITN